MLAIYRVRMPGFPKTVNRATIAVGRRGGHNLHSGLPDVCTHERALEMVSEVRSTISLSTEDFAILFNKSMGTPEQIVEVTIS